MQFFPTLFWVPTADMRSFASAIRIQNLKKVPVPFKVNLFLEKGDGAKPLGESLVELKSLVNR